MRRGRNRTNLYILLVALIVALIAAYFLPDKRPQHLGRTATTTTKAGS